MGENIKITMLGATNVGKTCYMVGMYAVMRTGRGTRGFTFSTQDPDDDLDLSDAWELMTSRGDNSRWPPPTIDAKTYPFDFNYGFGPIMGFDWLDYRGGAMRDRSTTEDVQALQKQMRESSCILLCVAGDQLAASLSGTGGNVRTESRIDRMNGFLQDYRKINGRTVPICIVITKYDKCRGQNREAVIDYVIDDLFAPLFAEGAGWHVMICPVSLGRELANNPAGRIDPINVHAPVAFAIYGALNERNAHIAGQISARQREIEEMKGGFLDLKALIYKGKIQQTEEQKRNLERQLEKVNREMQLLTRELLSDKHIYFDGRKVELNG